MEQPWSQNPGELGSLGLTSTVPMATPKEAPLHPLDCASLSTVSACLVEGPVCAWSHAASRCLTHAALKIASRKKPPRMHKVDVEQDESDPIDVWEEKT